MTELEKSTREIRSAFERIDLPEAFLSAYDQLECLASHRYSETFLVAEKRTGQLFIAKCYDKARMNPGKAVSLLQGLNHRALPGYTAQFENDRKHCIIREYVDGTPLNEYARDNEFTETDVTGICLQLADILIYLHEQNPPIIHRDIKPENIIVRQDGSIALIDFDIARHVKEDAESDTLFFGTKGYAPPEQYGFAQTDCRADIYSFGVLLRFLLTDSIRPNKKIRLYPPLQRIIDRCTAFSPDMRYSSMNAVKRALKEANPRAQACHMAKRCAMLLLAGVLAWGCGTAIYHKLTYSPFRDGSVIPAVLQDEARQREALEYLSEKYGTHLLDDTASYFTVGRLKDMLTEVYGMEESYARTSSPVDPPIENPEHFLPWSLGDEQYVNRDYLAYFVTKVYWPDLVADWTALKEATDAYPGITIAKAWCDEHSIMTGVNRPMDVSCGEAAIAFSNADRVSEYLASGSK
ncbi:MAG: serine/threonine protein kinase [Clostridia bacterium]|nr:serine/threonine protein kinase [Clostridia bacterium]